MKHLFLFCLSIILVSSVNAQELRTKDGFISISLGAALPYGDFADDDLNNNDAGLAESGVSVNLVNFGYLFSKNIGITAMLQGAAFPLDNGNAGNDPIWSYGTFLVGPLFTIRNQESKTEFDFRFMFGSMSGQLDPDNGGEAVEGEGGALAIGSGLRYNISDLIAFTANLDIISGKPEFEVNGNTFDQTMSSANITFGIAFRLY